MLNMILINVPWLRLSLIMVDKKAFDELSNKFSKLEKHCSSLEIAIQSKEESFQLNKPCKNPELPEFREFFVINELKVQIEAKTLTINNLKNRISVMCDMCNEVSAKHANDVTATKILEQSVDDLLLENKCLKRNCNDLNKLIKETRNRAVDHTNFLIAKHYDYKALILKRNVEIEKTKSNVNH